MLQEGVCKCQTTPTRANVQARNGEREGQVKLTESLGKERGRLRSRKRI